MKIKVWYYQWYKISPRGIVTINPSWFPQGDSPFQEYWIRDNKSKRRFKEIEDDNN